MAIRQFSRKPSLNGAGYYECLSEMHVYGLWRSVVVSEILTKCSCHQAQKYNQMRISISGDAISCAFSATVTAFSHSLALPKMHIFSAAFETRQFYDFFLWLTLFPQFSLVFDL